MKRRNTDDSDIDMLAAAYLLSENKTQKDIAFELELSEAKVSRLLTKARGTYLRDELRFLDDMVPDEQMELVHLRVTRRGLQDKLNKMAARHRVDRKVSLRVYHCGPCANDKERMKKLGVLAAPHVRRLLLRSKLCGLTWGGMLKSVVTGLRNLSCPPPWAQEPIQFFPLSGEPLARERSSFSSSSLARDLGIIVNGEQYDAPSLAMVPAFVPNNFGKYEKVGVWRLIELVKSYSAIFGPHQNGSEVPQTDERAVPLAFGLDMVLTSVGSQDRPLGFGRGVLFEQMSVGYEELKSMIVAEVGGVCIPRPKLPKHKLEQLETVQKNWTGLRLEHLGACSQRGISHLKGPPGVVVVSGGLDRAAGVGELIKRGLVNHLIVDEVLADELEKASS